MYDNKNIIIDFISSFAYVSPAVAHKFMDYYTFMHKFMSVVFEGARVSDVREKLRRV